ANAVNEAGTTVGVSSKYDGGTLVGDRAVIWRHDGDSAIDLNDLGVAPVEAGGGVWTLTSAYAMSADGWVAGTGSFDPDGAGSLNSYTRHWVAQVGLGGSWTKASGGVWGRGPNWSSGTPATQVGDANFNLAGDYIVGLDRDETTRSISVNAGNVTLDLNNFQLQSTGQVSIAANKTLTIRDGNLAAASGLSIGAGGMLIGDATSSDVAVSGAISGAGGLTKTGSGVLTLSGVSTNTGATMIGDGTLRLGANGALPGAITIGSSATFDLNNFDTTIGSLTGAGAVTLGAGELATGGNNTTTTYSGDVSGAGGLTKTGSGVLSLSGANSYAGATRIHGGTLQLESALGAGAAVTIDGSATLVANASVARSVQGTVSSKIVASGGDIALGNSSTFTGFGHAGTLAVGSNTVTLNSRGYASLGVVTDLNGGVLQATNGILLGAGSNLSGSGAVNAKLAAGFGSIVNATGSLALGKATDVSGFFSDGELYTNEHTVTIHDKNEAVLGSLTQLGNGSTGGRLVAGTASVTDSYPHFLVEAGKNVVGRGEIAGHFKNQGHVIGDGDTLSERIVFESDWTVSGSGTFANTLVLGTFAPGNSPTISNGKNQGFGGAVQIEIGGLTPGNSNNNHDQINDSGTILVLPGTTLTIDPWNNFLPEFGNQFTVMSWTDGLDGVFDNVVVNPFYTTQGFNFTLQYNNVGGAGNLVLTAVLPGDLNGDVFVGQDDLNLILGNWGQDVPPGNPLADADGSGFVGQDDLNVVLGRWGQGNPPNVTPVPEPTTFLLMGLAGVGLVAIRRRRHWSTPIVYLR
ncbi:MAG: autotransporter-associated beta strand repeat-containing protein, partial [Planctomycetota bacterium]|nr:autotransporter-associated beta strand repeat-containing protein [Planctomycetota bacterium]